MNELCVRGIVYEGAKLKKVWADTGIAAGLTVLPVGLLISPPLTAISAALFIGGELVGQQRAQRLEAELREEFKDADEQKCAGFFLKAREGRGDAAPSSSDAMLATRAKSLLPFTGP